MYIYIYTYQQLSTKIKSKISNSNNLQMAKGSHRNMQAMNKKLLKITSCAMI